MSLVRGTLGILFLFAATAVFAYDWPAPDIAVRKTFAQRSGTNFEPGLEFDTDSGQLTVPEKGQVIFVFSPHTGSPQNLPSSLGGFVALAHEDNLRTVVCGVVPQVPDESTGLARGELLGTNVPANPGDLTRHQLFVFDQQLHEVVNPLLVFPPLSSNRSPVILDVRVVPVTGGDSESLFAHSHCAVGYWNLYVDAVDPARIGGADISRGVYSVSAFLNGQQVFRMELTSLQDKEGQWIIKGSGQPLASVLDADHEWYLGRVFFNQGTNFLELSIKNFQGKESGRTFRVMGDRP
ncbi:MAG: hypothetical protein HKM06_00400 [Spirochaetales bacterium]|nr:hypothetical protein [Spirochaetales bacterium]